jgi:hypothetical protein
MKKPDHRHRRLLCARCDRPSCCRTAKPRDELAPLHPSLPKEAQGYHGQDQLSITLVAVGPSALGLMFSLGNDSSKAIAIWALARLMPAAIAR